MADLFVGEDVDTSTHQRTGSRVLLRSGDFTTHGVIVGMTGSGKTGLGVVLIEECLRNGIPALLIDPKGDLTNLCLTFPDLSPSDFEPWVNPGDASKAGVSLADFAAQQASTWRDGLASWALGGEQITALRDTVDFTIYTPGSTAGVAVNIVGSLQAPADTSDLETMRDEIEGYVSGLLGLVGIQADPLSSREHILLANLIESAWVAGSTVDLATLVGQVQQPPLRKLGVFDIDDFFPLADRTALAMRLNGLLASPSFAAWAAGPPLDVQHLLYRSDGRPRCAIITTAHLSDDERQFVTALVLAKLVTWMRRQSGTTDLRALLYMDEVAGYVPPTAVPPTKKPIMTLMKQARAFGVGVVLSTQNPVDLDYKAISNAGTWMIGRLQTDRDKARLLDGMSSAAGGVDIRALDDTISSLGKREFILRRAGKDVPEVFTTRWAMSYLRGPLTRDQIATLMADRRGASADATQAAGPTPTAVSSALADDETSVMPEIAGGIAVRWVDPAAPWLAAVGADPRGTRYEAAIIARVALRYDDAKADLVHDEEYEAVLFPLLEQVDVTNVMSVDYDDRDLRDAPLIENPVYGLVSPPVKDKTFWTGFERDLIDHLVRSRTMEIPMNRELRLYGRPGETPEMFAARCAEAADEGADRATAMLRDKYETKAKRIRDRAMSLEDKVELLAEQQKGRRSEELLSTAGSILGGLFGGRRNSRQAASSILGKLGGAAGRRSRTSQAERRLESAKDQLDALHDDLADLEVELATEVQEINDTWDAKEGSIETLGVTLERTDVKVTSVCLAWLPVS